MMVCWWCALEICTPISITWVWWGCGRVLGAFWGSYQGGWGAGYVGGKVGVLHITLWFYWGRKGGGWGQRVGELVGVDSPGCYYSYHQCYIGQVRARGSVQVVQTHWRTSPQSLTDISHSTDRQTAELHHFSGFQRLICHQ